MANRTTKTNEFLTTGDSGRRYRVIEVTVMTNTDPLLDPDRWEKGPRKLQLPNGNPVEELGDGRYRIASTGEVLLRDE